MPETEIAHDALRDGDTVRVTFEGRFIVLDNAQITGVGLISGADILLLPFDKAATIMKDSNNA